MKETVLEFGPGGRVVGILCQPDGGTARAPLAVVITNSGIIHRIGANRLHVRLARWLAEQGYASLRYDLPGIGDSEMLGLGPDVFQEQLAATRLAISTLQRLDVADGYVMLGLCSGASHSLAAAAADPRISGAVLIDPPVMVATRRHRLHQLLDSARRGLRPRVWWRLIRGRYQVRTMIEHRSIEPARAGMPVSVPNSPESELRGQAATVLKTVVDRRTQLWIVITGHNRGIYSYRRQLFDSFPEIAGLEDITHISLRRSAAHTFGRETDRRFLETNLVRWLQSATFAQSGGGATAPPALQQRTLRGGSP
jgi:pimeloyl-ACP methyl ester carboxylesterase